MAEVMVRVDMQAGEKRTLVVECPREKTEDHSVAGTIIGGLLGAAAGPIGLLIGAGIGAAIGSPSSKA